MTTVYFATNRNPISSPENPTDFGTSFALRDLGDLRFGQAEVTKDSYNIKVLPDNPKEGSMSLFESLRKAMKNEEVDSLVFIHGFNTTFDQAIKAGAEIGERYKELSNGEYSPNIFVFTWPSDGVPLGYGNDRHDAEASGYAFARGLVKLSGFLHSLKKNKNKLCNQKINLVAHSMGNTVLKHALLQARKMNGNMPLLRIFDDIVLAAADEDTDAFEYDDKLARLPEWAQRVTVYFNNGDKALVISDVTKGNPDRLGHDGPSRPNQLPAKVVAVDATDVVPTDVGDIAEHSYYVDVDKVAKDIIAVLQGKRSDEIQPRTYVAHANKYKLV